MASSSTLQFVDIADIRDDILILKDSTMRAVLEIGSINFELRSGDEQAAILVRFQDFLNSLDFPVQMVVHSRPLNIKEYLESLNQLQESAQNELLRVQAVEYARFIKGLVELSNIMARRFFVVIPFYLIEAAGKQGVTAALKGIIGYSGQIQTMDESQFDLFRGQLRQRVALVQEGLSTMGLEVTQLKYEELVNLYYQLYNPGSPEKIRV